MIQDTWLLLGIFAVLASFSIWASKFTKWGNYLGYVNISVILGLIAVNLNIVPDWSDVHKLAFSYCVPIAVVLVLLQADLRILKKVGGKLLLALACGVVFTMVAAIAAGFIFNVGPETWKVFACYAAGYVGNAQTLNLVGAALEIDASTLVFVNASDSIIYIIYALILFQCGKWAILKKNYVSYKDILPSGSSLETGTACTDIDAASGTLSAAPAGGDAVSGDSEEVRGDSDGAYDSSDDSVTVKGEEVGIVLGAAVGIVALGEFLGQLTGVLSMIFYVAIAVLVANTTPIKKYKINDKIGTWLFCLFMVAIGASAPISALLSAPIGVFAGCVFVIACTIILFLIFGKLFKLPLEYMIIASMACIGGAVSTPPLAQTYKWNDLVLPGLFCGIIAQVLGSYCGLAVGYILLALL